MNDFGYHSAAMVRRKLPKPSITTATETRTNTVEQLLWFIVAATMLVTPLLVTVRADQLFRLPKELIVRAAGILIATIAALGLLWGTWRPALRLRDRPVLITTAVLVWTLLTATLSTNHLLSMFTAVRVCALAAFFLAAYELLRTKSFRLAIWLLVVPALANAVLTCLQELDIWNPFTFEPFFLHHAKSSGLIGNVNDVGAYLIVPTIVAIVAVIINRKDRRALVPAAVVLVCALILNQTLTALVAFATGALAIALMTLPGRRKLVAAIFAVLIVLTFAFFPPLRRRVGVIRDLFHEGRYDQIVSGRLPAFAAAVAMVEQYPVTGVGPGCFGFHYYLFRLRMEQRHPFLLTSMTRMQNFGEAHNDHLQVAAEAGIPGFALLSTAIVYVGSLSFRVDAAKDPRLRFVRLLALPFALSTFVLMLAQFPLQLAAPTINILYVAALCAAWDSPDAQRS
jgi:O-antigen ligase